MTPVIYSDHITREYLRQNRELLALFGDNIAGYGLGGQAKEMRGEPNTVPIFTKRKPTCDEDAYFTDQDIPFFRARLIPPYRIMKKYMANGGTILCPSAGVGTDRADLPNRAPKCFALLKKAFTHLGIEPPDWKGKYDHV